MTLLDGLELEQPFFGHGVGPVAIEHAEIKGLLVRQMPHTGDEGVRKGAVVCPRGEDFVDGRVVEGRPDFSDLFVRYVFMRLSRPPPMKVL